NCYLVQSFLFYHDIVGEPSR
ncbi:hypothetical protein AALP_AA3G089000, partial [Arabis alpina]